MADTAEIIVELDSLGEIQSYLQCADISKVVTSSKLTADDILKLKELFSRQTKNYYTVRDERDIAVLKHFADLLPRLELDYEDIEWSFIGHDGRKTGKAVENAILQYCSDSLEAIKLHLVKKHTFANIRKPFANVTYVSICDGHLGENLSQFNRWFPKMNKLRLQALSFEKLECLEQNFPNLKHLAIDNNADWHYGGCDRKLGPVTTDSTVKLMLEKNPQLESLELNDDCGGRDDYGICLSPKSLSYVACKLPGLRELVLQIRYFDYAPSHPHGNIYFNQLSSLKIFVYDWSCLSKFSIETKGQLDLCLGPATIGHVLQECQQMYENVAKFTKKMTNNLKSLAIRSDHDTKDLYAKYLIDFIASCENLESYSIKYDCGSNGAAHAIIYFLINCKQVMKFTGEIRGSTNVQQKSFVEAFTEYEKTVEFNAADWTIEFVDMRTVSITKQS